MGCWQPIFYFVLLFALRIAAAFQYQGNAPGNTGTASFVNGNEEWAAMTMTIAPNPVPSFLCAGVDGSISGSQPYY